MSNRQNKYKRVLTPVTDSLPKDNSERIKSAQQ